MQYVKFGNTGMDVSRICLGMMSFGKPGKENGVFPWAKNYEDGKEIFKYRQNSKFRQFHPQSFCILNS